MQAIIGILITLGLVFGIYMASGGKMDIILHALPHELGMIGGSAVGAFVVSNSMSIIKHTLSDLKKVNGSKWKKKDYIDILTLLFLLTKLMKTKGVIAIESHIEKPGDSNIFSKYPKILKDHFATDLICDTLRMMTMNMDDPHQIEDHIERQLENHHHEHMHPAHALQTMADGLPALGIVAAVLGVIKTMASIDQPPTILGKMIGGALVGTFLGVFLAYGMVGPLAARLKQVNEEEAMFYQTIKAVLVSYLNGNAAQVAVEVGRGNVPGELQPSFAELEEILNEAKID